MGSAGPSPEHSEAPSAANAIGVAGPRPTPYARVEQGRAFPSRIPAWDRVPGGAQGPQRTAPGILRFRLPRQPAVVDEGRPRKNFPSPPEPGLRNVKVDCTKG